MRGRGNIPAAVGGLIGREREIEEVRALLRRSRLLTLTGAGGMGESRLAIEVSRQEQAEHHDGVWIIELSGRAGVSAGLTSHIERGQGNPSLLTLTKIARALGVQLAEFLEPAKGSSAAVIQRKDRPRLSPPWLPQFL